MQAGFILYVRDQQRSRDLYRGLLGREPVLDVPGMTEFDLGTCTLGLMPSTGIARIITPALPHPAGGHGVPRCELYLRVADLDAAIDRTLQAGATVISPATDRDWGDRVAYFADPDGHVIALARALRG
ncbi:MAG: VOC family protein [Flavobacteriales bacterium]|nr:VOC family protein [Flavobacteriales bacterium]